MYINSRRWGLVGPPSDHQKMTKFENGCSPDVASGHTAGILDQLGVNLQGVVQLIHNANPPLFMCGFNDKALHLAHTAHIMWLPHPSPGF